MHFRICSHLTDRNPQKALPVAAFPEMLTKAVVTYKIVATTSLDVFGASRVGKRFFQGAAAPPAAEDDRRPSILQVKTDGLTTNKISVIEQLAYKNKALVIAIRRHHCTTADKLVIAIFSLARSVLSRKYGLAVLGITRVRMEVCRRE